MSLRTLPRRAYTADDGLTPPAGAAPVEPVTPPAEPAPAPAASPAEPETSARTYTAAEYREVVSEARNLRARLRETEQTAGQHGAALEAARADADALRAQLATASEALRAYRLRDAIADTARASDDLRGIDPDLAARLVEVEYGEDGRPKGLTAALKSLVERYPQIAGPARPRVPAQPPAGGAPPAGNDADVAAQKRRQFGTIF